MSPLFMSYRNFRANRQPEVPLPFTQEAATEAERHIDWEHCNEVENVSETILLRGVPEAATQAAA
jgi:hypothetical protein